MNIERVLQICLAMLSVVGTLFLGCAQRNFTAPMLMVFVAVSSLLFTDRWQWFRLGRSLANLAALAAAIYSLRQFWNSYSHQQLDAIADLLIGLQVILMYQEKTHRIYWHLMTLSLLQVVVAAALSVGPEFGLLLTLFLGLEFTALTLAFVTKETRRFTGDPGRSPLALASGTVREGRSPLTLSGPLGQPMSTVPVPISTAAADRLLHGGLWLPILTIATATLFFALVDFYATPRLTGSSWQNNRGGRAASVGFSSQVTFDEMGEVLQTHETALRISFLHADTGLPYPVKDDLYLRGAVLTRYGDEINMGEWGSSIVAMPDDLPSPPDQKKAVRQQIRLQPTRELTLFSVFPACALDGLEDSLTYERTSGKLDRRSDGGTMSFSPFHYEVGTTGFVNGVQPRLVAAEDWTGSARDRRKKNQLLKELTVFEVERFPTLASTARKVLDEANAMDSDAFRRARILESHFLKPKNYQYSLNFDFPRDKQLDPLEDFVANHHTGHCEYFASALVMMLRSQDIPARLILGFHGGELNSVGDYFLLRQSDAHAWVEAYLSPEELAKANIAEAQTMPHGAWFRLDPTPGYDATRNKRNDRFLGPIGDALDYAQYIWNDYVVGLNPERQRTSAVSALSNPTGKTWGEIMTAGNWQMLISKFSPSAVWSWTWEDWFSWRAGVLAMIVSLTAVVVFRWLHRQWSQPTSRLRRAWMTLQQWRTSIRRKRDPRIAFYLRLEKSLAKRGCHRAAHQTQREFIDAAVTKLDHLDNAARLALQRIVAAFYRVRFGESEISESEQTALTNDLRFVEETMQRGISNGR